jgi:hypothetical protein
MLIVTSIEQGSTGAMWIMAVLIYWAVIRIMLVMLIM